MWLRWILVPNRDLSGVGCGNLGEVGGGDLSGVGEGNLNGVEKQRVAEIPELTGQQSSSGFREKPCL